MSGLKNETTFYLLPDRINPNDFNITLMKFKLHQGKQFVNMGLLLLFYK